MAGSVAPPPQAKPRTPDALPFVYVNGLLDSVDGPMLVTERSGKVLLINRRAKKYLEPCGATDPQEANLFSDFLRVESNEIFGQIEGGKHEVELEFTLGGEQCHARLQWMPEPEWLVVHFVAPTLAAEREAATQLTVQELLQEREITYRNLLAAYLKLQEVNRQKTVFL